MNIIKYIIDVILKLKKDFPIIIAFDGVDTSGKTSLADNIYNVMIDQSIFLPIRISIDKFHNPKNIQMQKDELSPEGFYFDSFNYEGIINNIIKLI